MATIVLQAAGAFLGNVIGGPIGALVGQTVGAVAGASIDRAVLSHVGQRNSAGPRLTRLPGVNASEGSPIARVYGRARTGGTIIWMTRFEETVTTTRAGGAGGKGGGAKTRQFKYAANFAVGICEGEIAEVRRIWADGVEIDQTKFTIRVYNGTNDQQPDALIVAKEGATSAPAYRGLAYIVFERMPLENYGNRIPQLSFEVVRPLNGAAALVRSICIIPGSSEDAYSPALIFKSNGVGSNTAANRHVLTHASDWDASIDALQALCPNLECVSLVVAWFGNDLRAASCTIEPRVEDKQKKTPGVEWRVAGLSRLQANEVSQFNGKPAYGGTPSDASVKSAIADLKARGLKIVLYPFVMMDIPLENENVDPWTGAALQPAYPWRGRITCDPAPDRAETADGTPLAAVQTAAFFGSAEPPVNEFSYRRFILHYANLCVEAGGVEAFLIGSELVGLTRVRSAVGIYPAVQALVQLAGDVRAILPLAKISYAADWTEYGAHVRNNGVEVGFPLDPLWSSSDVDFVGIDAYWPLSDWRDGSDHLDSQEASSIHDVEFLRDRIGSGEAFDWYYLDEAARIAQVRQPVTDGAYAKPWTYRQKDLAGWWSNLHYPRVDGVELALPTSWIAGSKPIWLTETGCPAVDRGANAPNAFPDEKSSENRLPWFSRGGRDDLMALRYIEAYALRFDPSMDGHDSAHNPMSPLYGERMLDPARIFYWAWDARPFPAFPLQSSVWGDASAWRSGHWLNGRLEAAELNQLVIALINEMPNLEGVIGDTKIDGVIDGYILDGPVSPRGAIEPLAAYAGFDAVISSGQVRFRSKRQNARVTIDEAQLIGREPEGLFEISRAQESEINRELSFSFLNAQKDYAVTTVNSRRLECESQRMGNFDASIAVDRSAATRAIDVLLQDQWHARERLHISLMPSQLHIESGDLVSLQIEGRSRTFQVEQISDGPGRDISARAIETSIFDHPAPLLPMEIANAASSSGPPHVEVLNLSLARGEFPVLQHVAVYSEPWPGPMAVWRSVDGASFEFRQQIDYPAIIGETMSAFAAGPPGRIDRANVLTVQLEHGALSSVSDVDLFGGRNWMAIGDAQSGWEVFAFANAELIAQNTWRLSRLVRGLGGEEHLAKRSLAAGARVVLLDQALYPLISDISELGLEYIYRIGPADFDHAHVSYVEFTAKAERHALRPYAPVKVEARRNAGGVDITGLRRGRLNADNWELLEIPLGEDISAFEVEIWSGDVLKRTIATSSLPAQYILANELADFGSQQSELDLRVYQLSAMAGRGYPFGGVIPVR